MTTPAEDTLYAALNDIEELEEIARMGLALEAIPTEVMRPVVKWALDYYYDSGRRQAPTRAMLLDAWGQQIEDAEVELLPEEQERDSIYSALSQLRGHHAQRQFQTFLKESAAAMATAPIPEKVDTLTQITSDLFGVTNDLIDHSNMVQADLGIRASMRDYQERESSGNTVDGLTFGWDQVDTHTGGIRAGELAVLGAGPKTGKSYFLDMVALHEWRRGRRTVLFTLENSVEMTYDRIVCLAARVSARRYQRGCLTDTEKETLERFVKEELDDLDRSLLVISPPKASRTPEMIVRQAAMQGADSILVDQLTHVVHPNPGRKARHELFNENVHDFYDQISIGRERFPMLLAHQINREGVKAADKQGYLEMHHLAESQGLERAASWVFGLYQSQTYRAARMAFLQVLAARREDIKNWELLWDVEVGMTGVRGEVDLG